MNRKRERKEKKEKKKEKRKKRKEERNYIEEKEYKGLDKERIRRQWIRLGVEDVKYQGNK